MRVEVSIRSKTYVGASGQSHDALREVAFVLDKGRVGAIVGPSGCGKTTLLRIVAGLDRSFDGVVALAGLSRLAVVFQEPRLLPWRSVEHNVRLAAPEVGEAELAALFAALGLADHRQRYPGELSLGLARRVAFARALAVQPDLLLLDEPFASLDAATASGLIDELTAFIKARSVTTLLVTHDIDAAIRLADTIFVLSPGPGRLLAQIPIPEPRRRPTPEAMTEIAARIDALTTAAAKRDFASSIEIGGATPR